MSIKAPKYLILVGTGDYYYKIIGPSLALLQKEGLIRILATVSTSGKSKINNAIEHRIRKPNAKLSRLLADLKKYEPVVILAHTNELHASDARDLLMSGFTVFVEKPYAINQAQMREAQKMARAYPKKLVPLEYYLMMKAVPLLIICGKIKPQCFYFQKNSPLKYYKNLYELANTPANISGLLNTLIGKPRFVLVDILEGKEKVGRLDHRGDALSDASKGGGMIQDLGIHAVSPLFALEDYIGKIDESFKQGVVRTAKCQEYIQSIKSKYHLSNSKIAESYAEIKFSTSDNVPVVIAVGKYFPGNKNQRRIIIIGTKGKIYLDLSSCTLYLSRGEETEKPIMQQPKKTASKYYPVLLAALNMIEGKSPFAFNATDTALRAQQFILNAIKKSYS